VRRNYRHDWIGLAQFDDDALTDGMHHAFKTPTLRSVALPAPFP
jgi:cytochrome c peroxidase